MNGYNHVTLLGNLGRDPEVRQTPSGRMVCHLALATNRPVKTEDGWTQQTDWHHVTLWEHQAEIASRFLTKGSPVFIEGQLRTDGWIDKKTEEKRYRTYVKANRLVLLPGPGRAGASDAHEAAQPAMPSDIAESDIPESDIPF